MVSPVSHKPFPKSPLLLKLGIYLKYKKKLRSIFLNQGAWGPLGSP